MEATRRSRQRIGDFGNGGREWRPQGDPEKVRQVLVAADASGSNASRRLRQSNGRFTFTVALCAAAMLAGGVHADLFLPVGPADAAAGAAPAARTVPLGAERAAPVVGDVWERRVRIARHELAVARADIETAGSGRLFLNVRDGVRLDVVVERTAPTKRGYSLSGRVAGASAGFVTLVVHEEAVAGSIWTPDSAYELNYLGGGVHALRDVTNAPPVECGGALPSGLSAADAPGPGGADDGSAVSVVDILVVWTPAAEEEYGGEPQALSRIDLLIAYANDAFERSGAFVALNLVGAEKVDYLEADSGDWLVDAGTDLSRLGDPHDGHMDRVHDRRDALGADLVYLVTSGYGGLAGSAISAKRPRLTARCSAAGSVSARRGAGPRLDRMSGGGDVCPEEPEAVRAASARRRG